MSLREEILAIEAPPLEPVEAFGRTLFLRRLSGAERDNFEASKVDVRLDADGNTSEARLNLGNIRARLAVLVLADESGRRIFRDQDAEALGAKEGFGLDLDRVYEAAVRLNGLDRKALERARKNSAPGQNGCSGTDWPGSSACPCDDASERWTVASS